MFLRSSFFAFLLATGAVGCAATITIGDNTSSNLYPFNSNLYVGEYQQVYAASAFSGPVEITAITFFPSDPSSTINGTYTIDLSTTSAGVGSLSTDYANNIGANNTQFFSAAVSGVLSFSGGPFLYDPSQGNLLMDVNVITPYEVFGGSGSLIAGPSQDTDRVYKLGGIGPNSGPVTTGYITTPGGLLTMFTFSPVSSVPEPSSFSLLGSGIVGLLGALKIKKLRFRRNEPSPSIGECFLNTLKRQKYLPQRTNSY